VRGGNAESAFTRKLLAEILCSAEPGLRPCLSCAHCVKALRGIHPDVTAISRLRDERGLPKREIAVEQVREAVLGASVAPNEASRRVLVIEEAEKMHRGAQNALLKTLEEPPEHIVTVLISDSPGALLPTIRSRCRVIESGEPPAGAPDSAAALAEAYFAAARSGPARLTEFSFELDKAERRELPAFLSEIRRLAAEYLREALEAGSGNFGAGSGSFETGAGGLPPETASAIAAAAREAERYLNHNVGAIHISARLCSAALRAGKSVI
jgi:hypothetical protein